MSAASVALLLKLHDGMEAFCRKVSDWIRSPRPAIDIPAVQEEAHKLHDFARQCRRIQLGRIRPDDSGSPLRVLGELDIINAYARVRAYYLNIAETLAGGK